MGKFISTILGLLLVASSAYATPPVSVDKEVHDYLQLLVRKDEPTYAEYLRFAGSEGELSFELRECRSRGWEIYSESCIAFTRDRANSADKQNSLYLSWVRTRFSTVGASYRIIGSKLKTEGIRHNLIEVVIGKNGFLLIHNIHPGRPTSLLVGISRVNDKLMEDYLKDEGSFNIDDK